MMNGRYKLYPEYKDSNIQWVGSVPIEWTMIRGKFYFHSKKIINKNLQCMDRLALTLGGVIERSIDSNEGLQPTDFSTYQIFEKDNLVFKLIDLENFQTSRVGIVPKNGIMSSAYIRLIPNEAICPKYFYYFYYDLYLRGIYNEIGGQGVRSSLGVDDLLELLVCGPNFSEQESIASFLDHETTKIDTLIAKQQELIKLLKEKRQAVISHAVTKGLNPNAPMRDSGVEWFDKIPSHWVVSKFSYLSMVVRGGSPRPAGDLTLFNGNFSPWVTVAEITKDNEIYLNETETFLTQKGSEQCRVFSADTLILSNSGGTLGVPKILKINANANDGVLGFENLNLSREFAYFYLTTLTEKLREQIRNKGGSTQINLNTDIVKDISVPVPPNEEIEEIVAHIFKAIEIFKILEDKTEAGIQLLKERRTALISAAVTGKIDVRDWQPAQNPELEDAAA
nr:restriction endonuclease subunit S [uncultured Undibacterium sp.]